MFCSILVVQRLTFSGVRAALPDKFVGTLATSPSPLNVGLHDAKYKRAKNNIERGRGAKGYRVGVYNTVSQLIMSGSIF